MSVAAIGTACAVGCGDTEAYRCLADHHDEEFHTDCLSAKELARRDSQDLVVSQEDLDWYLDVYQRGYMPLSDELGAPPTTDSWWPHLNVLTGADTFVEPWVRGDVVTGVPAVDAVLTQAHVDEVLALGMMPGPYFTFRSSTHVLVYRNVAAALQGIPDLQVTATFFPAEEGTGWSDAFLVSTPRAPGGVDIVYRRGWGPDCTVGCSQVSWRVHVTDDTAQLVERWIYGSPPPPEVLESWRQTSGAQR